MVHVGCVVVASIHPCRTWMSGSFESMGWNACMHRLDLGLYSYPTKFGGNGVRTHVNSKGKIPSTRGSEEGRIYGTASRTSGSPTLPTELFQPLYHIHIMLLPVQHKYHERTPPLCPSSKIVHMKCRGPGGRSLPSPVRCSIRGHRLFGLASGKMSTLSAVAAPCSPQSGAPSEVTPLWPSSKVFTLSARGLGVASCHPQSGAPSEVTTSLAQQ